jgi:hypothetical protein
MPKRSMMRTTQTLVSGKLLLFAASLVPVITPCSAAPDIEGRREGVGINVALVPNLLPHWENGYYFGVEHDAVNGPLVSAFDENGALLFRTALSGAGANSTAAYGMAASREGVFAVSLGLVDPAGQAAGAIAILDRAGNVLRRNGTVAYFPAALRFAADGSIWTIGDLRNTGSGGHPQPVLTVRKYSASGGPPLVEKTFSVGPGRRHPAFNGVLAINGHRVAVLLPDRNEIIVLSADGEEIGRSTYPPIAPLFMLTGFAMNAGHRIYLSGQARQERNGAGAVLFLRWEPESGGWSEVYRRAAAEPEGFHAIFGFEGNNMLVSTRLPRFRWLLGSDR